MEGCGASLSFSGIVSILSRGLTGDLLLELFFPLFGRYSWESGRVVDEEGVGSPLWVESGNTKISWLSALAGLSGVVLVVFLKGYLGLR